MTFTDDDLKRLEERISIGAINFALTRDECEALLARLEAAERALTECLCDEYHDCNAHLEWRKAAGK